MRCKKIILTALFFSLAYFSSAAVADLNDIKVPEELKKWQDWVLFEKTHYLCPTAKNNQKHCIYKSKLNLIIDSTQKLIRFNQNIKIYSHNNKVYLPKTNSHYPVNVKINGQLFPVMEKHAQPYIILNPGNYTLSGEIPVIKVISYIQLSKETVLIDLFRVTNQKLKPDLNYSIDNNNRVWLRQIQPDTTDKEKPRITNREDIQIFRKIQDDIPLLVESIVKLQISGQPRELKLKHFILDNFEILKYRSQLPIKINHDQSITVQIKPGNWNFSFTLRQLTRKDSIDYKQTLKVKNKTKIVDEIWVFQENPILRQVEIIAEHMIDSTNTLLPQNWKKFPAYLMKEDTQFLIRVKKRGNDTPSKNQLSVEREIWIDYSGKGMTLKDNIKGQINRDWRLDFLDSIKPGKVSLNGQYQLITEGKENLAGVEVQNGRIHLIAESRIEENITEIPAVDFAHEFSTVLTTLYLPPGWSIFYARGIDSISSSWVSSWTLMDLFQVLLLSVIFYKLFGIQWGILSLIFFSIIVHKYNAPSWIWIHILIAISMLGIIREGQFHKYLTLYKNISLSILALMLILFIVDEVKYSVYPELKVYPSQINMPATQHKNIQNVQQENDEMMLMEQELPQAKGNVLSSMTGRTYDSYKAAAPVKMKKSKQLNRYSVNDKIQTGPGLPNWKMNQVKLNFNGPVSPDQTIKLYFINKYLNLFLTLLMVALSLLLFYRVIDLSALKGKLDDFFQIKTEKVKSHTSSIVMILCLCWTFQSNDALAETNHISAEILKEYQNRLLKKQPCDPECLNIEAINANIKNDSISMTIIAHAGQHASLAIPLNSREVIFNSIFSQTHSGENIKLQYFVKNSANNQIQIPLKKGRHHIFFTAQINNSKLTMRLSVPTHNIQINSKQWTISGLKDQEPISQEIILEKKSEIMLNNEQKVKKDKININTHTFNETNEIPVFTKIIRRFYFDLDWTIQTRVERISDKDNQHRQSLVFDYPLLIGESVIDANKSIKNKLIKVKLNTNQNQFSWNSKIEKDSELTLSAIENLYWIEQWEFIINPVWHIEIEGFPPIQHVNDQRNHLPIYRPYAGESISLLISRPKAIAGQLKTIDYVSMDSTYNDSLVDHSLSFNINSSQGGQHQIKLPENAEILTLKIANKELAVDETNTEPILSLNTGSQMVEISWREKAKIPWVIHNSKVDLKLPQVNIFQTLSMPQNRWVIYTSGSTIGPVVLFWSLLVVLLIISTVVSKIPNIPISTSQALILAIGIAPVSIEALVFVLFWFIVLTKRGNGIDLKPVVFNLYQLALVAITLVTVFILLNTIESGLLGYPNMHITGNNSSSHLLKWYEDKSRSSLPDIVVLSLPILSYRILMLVWALWLATAVVKWSVWFWKCYSFEGYWKKVSLGFKNKLTGKNSETQSKNTNEINIENTNK